MNNQDAQRMRSETKVNYKPVSCRQPYQCGDSWRQDVVVEVTTIGRNGKSRTETFEVTVPVEKIDGAIRWSVRELSREIRSTLGGALLPDAMAARTAPPWVSILKHHGAIVSAQEQPYRWLLTVGQLATLWRTYLRSTYTLPAFAALFVHPDGKPYSVASLKTSPGADFLVELKDALDRDSASLNPPDA